jgi:hypothetical protein
MITRFKRADINKLIEQEEWFYPEISLIADKFRVIYTTLGWTHMTQDFFGVDNSIENLLMSGLEYLRDSKDGESQIESAGVMIQIYLDEEDYININFYFSME